MTFFCNKKFLSALSLFAVSVTAAVILAFYAGMKAVLEKQSNYVLENTITLFAFSMSVLTAIFILFVVLLVKKYLLPSIKENLEAKAKFESIAESVGEGIMTIDKNGIVTYINNNGAKMLGYVSSELLGKNVHETMHYETRDGEFISSDECPALQNIAKNGSYSSDDDVYIKKDKTKIDVSYAATPFIIAGHNEGAIVIFSDISEKKANIKKLMLSDAIVKSIREGVIVADKDSKIVFANEYFETITGYDKNEIIGKNPSILKSGMHDNIFYQNMWYKLSIDGCWQGEIWNRKKDGTTYTEWLSICVIDDSGDKYYVAAFSDITARKLLESELLKEREMLQEQVTYDSLTKLLNRRKMEETLELEIERFKRCNTPLSVVMFDIDDFKQINDTLGHQAGDATLRLVSELIKKTVRKVDFSARWGGEEFIVLAPQTDTKGAYTLAENLRKTIEGSNILQGKKITCSFGVTDFKENETLDSFLKRVDEALYASKKNGKNQVTLV